MSEHADRVRSYLQEILAGREVEESFSAPGSGLTEELSALGSQEEIDFAISGMENLFADSSISDEEADALEAIVLRRERPVVDIVGNTYHPPPRPWKHLAEEPSRTKIEDAIPAVGRVEIPNHPTKPYAGTGFIVGDGLLMTNRHVVESFATGVGAKQLHFIPGRTPGIDFKKEILPTPPEVLTISSVVMVHPFWDCAVVRVVGLPAGRKSLALAAGEPDGLMGREVVVIGYPAQDFRNDLQMQLRIFNGKFQIKRMQPGRLKAYQQIRSFGNTVEAITHDASTLGGNSGSAVVDARTGEVLGLHFAGIHMRANYAVPAWELARDTRLSGGGVRFTNLATVGDALPPWEHKWIEADLDAGVSPGSAGEQGSSSAASGSSTSVTGGPRPKESVHGTMEWYENVADAELQAAIHRDPEGTFRRLRTVLGEEDATDVMEDLAGEIKEGLFFTEPDPSLPEIVYLHGIMGGHLAADRGAGSKVWFNALALAKGNVAEKLTLEADGFTDSRAGILLGPAGHLKLKYGKAARRWRKQRFVVHSFTYDWRKPIAASADQLHGFIEQLAAGYPDRRFVIVAHSMGGLVSSIYAQRHPRWADRIQRAVFVGSPLGGSYAPVEAVLGVYPFFKTLATLSRHDGILDLQRLAATLPGLMEILPHPRLFADDIDCYALPFWPRTVPRPSQRWLDDSRNLKDTLLASPLLARTSGLVSRELPTVSSARADPTGQIMAGPRTGPGDGTVPIRAAAVAELKELYEATGRAHADLLNSKAVIDAVADLLRTGTTSHLARVRLADIDFDEVLPAPEAPDDLEAAAGGVRSRMDAGELTAADLAWLMDPMGSEPPQ